MRPHALAPQHCGATTRRITAGWLSAASGPAGQNSELPVATGKGRRTLSGCRTVATSLPAIVPLSVDANCRGFGPSEFLRRLGRGVIDALQAELRAVEHELAILTQIGAHPDSGEVLSALASREKIRAALNLPEGDA